MDPRNILLDLQTELSGELLSGTFEVRGRQFEMRLLNEEENSWAFGFMNTRSEMSLAMSARIATLSIGIKSINGSSIASQFLEVLLELHGAEIEEGADGEGDYSALMKKNGGSEELACYELFMKWLMEQPPTFVNDLNKCWQKLEKRRDAASEEVKNLSGEVSEKDESPSSTESSPCGESSLLNTELSQKS